MGVKSEIPTPGSDEALNQGCTCPVLDNGHGMGHMGEPGIFVPNEGCPLHGPRQKRRTMMKHIKHAIKWLVGWLERRDPTLAEQNAHKREMENQAEANYKSAMRTISESKRKDAFGLAQRNKSPEGAQGAIGEHWRAMDKQSRVTVYTYSRKTVNSRELTGETHRQLARELGREWNE